MRLLVATPYNAPHYDAGLFWVKAFVALGHEVVAWDYRQHPNPAISQFYDIDVSIVMKGESVPPELIPSPRVCYWPDALDRTPGIEKKLEQYDHVFTPVRPTPKGMTWLPTGWDPEMHRNLCRKRWINTIYVGTRNSPYKSTMVGSLKPEGLAGNGWGKDFPAIYAEDFVDYLNDGKILINLHQNPEVGVNRKLFEMIACGLTISDDAPGVRQILGKKLAEQLVFKSPRDAHKLIRQLLALSSFERDDLWQLEYRRIADYSYHNAAQEVIKCFES